VLRRREEEETQIGAVMFITINAAILGGCVFAKENTHNNIQLNEAFFKSDQLVLIDR